MIEAPKTAAKRFIASIGHRTDVHCIAFGSDDWGSVRIPSAAALDSYMRNRQLEPSKRYHTGKGEEACVADMTADLERVLRFGESAIFRTQRVNYASLIRSKGSDSSRIDSRNDFAESGVEAV